MLPSFQNLNLDLVRPRPTNAVGALNLLDMPGDLKVLMMGLRESPETYTDYYHLCDQVFTVCSTHSEACDDETWLHIANTMGIPFPKPANTSWSKWMVFWCQYLPVTKEPPMSNKMSVVLRVPVEGDIGADIFKMVNVEFGKTYPEGDNPEMDIFQIPSELVTQLRQEIRQSMQTSRNVLPLMLEYFPDETYNTEILTGYQTTLEKLFEYVMIYGTPSLQSVGCVQLNIKPS